MVAFAKLINYLERFFLTIKRILTVVVLVGCLITLSFFTPLFSTIVLFILDCYRLPESAVSVNPATAIVVLGGGLTNNQQNDIIINQFTESRLIKSSQVYQQTGLPIIVSGKEAPWMAKWLQKKGIMWVLAEKNSFNTCQNAKYTAEMVNVKQVILVTDAYHMNRSRRQFAINGVATVPSIAPLPKPNDWQHFDQNLQHSRRALYELLAFARDLVKPQYDCQPTNK